MNQPEKFPIEEIPDDDIVFLRIHFCNIDFEELDEKRKLRPVAFDPKPTNKDGLSVNWSKYSSAEITKEEVKQQIKRRTGLPKNPDDFGVVSFNVGKVRKIVAGTKPLAVIHQPTRNQAHSLICDIPPRKPNDLGVRMKLRDICRWEIPCNKK